MGSQIIEIGREIPMLSTMIPIDLSRSGMWIRGARKMIPFDMGKSAARREKGTFSPSYPLKIGTRSGYLLSL